MATPETPARSVLFVISVGLIAIPVLRDQIAELAGRGVTVHVAGVPEDDFEQMVTAAGGHFHPWEVSRAVSGLRAEVIAVRDLHRIMQRSKPDVVVAGTPKAGLLGSLVGRLSRVPRVIYTMHGLRLEGAHGLKRAALWVLELLTCSLAHVVHCVGHDLARRATQLKLVRPGAAVVIGSGSAAGIDVQRFSPADPDSVRAGRAALGVAPDRPLIGFVGRVTHDKGIADLVRLMERLAVERPEVQLAVVGSIDGSHADDPALVEGLRAQANITLVGPRSDVQNALNVFDLLVLPSIREGLPTVVIEAASCEVPSVMYACTGARDAVVDGVTGRVVPIGDTEKLIDAVASYLDHEELRASHGTAARQRILSEFDAALVVPALADFYLGTDRS